MNLIDQQLERAFGIALEAHETQVDQQGQPYLLHLIRVMLKVNGTARVVALLHDLVEDTPWTGEDLLREGFDPAIVEAVLALTRREDETYAQFIDRVQGTPLAIPVKIADLEDNLGRLEDLAKHDPAKAELLGKRYRKAHAQLIQLVR